MLYGETFGGWCYTTKERERERWVSRGMIHDGMLDMCLIGGRGNQGKGSLREGPGVVCVWGGGEIIALNLRCAMGVQLYRLLLLW